MKFKKIKKTRPIKLKIKKNKIYSAPNLTEFVLLIIMTIIGGWLFLWGTDTLGVPKIISYTVLGLLLIKGMADGLKKS
tara:strand:+ start:396 stop:629 length:234 start_codon:yes stop_codon:yes gene_type:complete